MASTNKVEVVLNIFMIEDGTLKILLGRKKEEPYKGYWSLPNCLVGSKDGLKEVVDKTMVGFALLPIESYISCKQGKVYDRLERKVEQRLFAVSYNIIIDSRVVLEKQLTHSVEELNWFPVSNTPKLAYDHEEIILNALDQLRDHILYHTGLQELFPSDFTLPELQRTYETITKKTCDRRNFRKKFTERGLLEDTGYQAVGSTGRPAKLYRFSSNIESVDSL